MNAENAHLYLPLVQALADGKTIEHSVGGQYWEKLDKVDFLFPPDQYRVAIEPQKPIEILVWVKKDGTPTMLALGCGEGDTWEEETVRRFIEVTNQ